MMKTQVNPYRSCRCLLEQAGVAVGGERVSQLYTLFKELDNL
jgi:hypothetical protein